MALSITWPSSSYDVWKVASHTYDQLVIGVFVVAYSNVNPERDKVIPKLLLTSTELYAS
jgi:hypothetical protein